MIESIRHKGLKAFYEEGNGTKLPPDLLPKIAKALSALDAVASDADIQSLGLGVHKLTGSLKDFWSIKISANYRIIFRFDDGDVLDVDYLDYH